MTPVIRQNPRPTGPVLPMSAHDMRYPHRLVMRPNAFARWKFPPCNTGKA